MLSRSKLWIATGVLVFFAGTARAEDTYKPDDDGFIRNWLVLAPIPNGENASGTDCAGQAVHSRRGQAQAQGR